LKDDVNSLIAGWLDGDLDTVEQERLEDWLREDPEHLDRLVEASIRDQQLREAVHVFERRIPAKFPQKRRHLGPLIAAAATVICGIGAALWLSLSRAGHVQVEVVSAENVRLENRTEALVSGSRLSLGLVFLESGRLEVDLASGVRLELIAPLKAEFLDDMHLRLESGRLNADVGERGKGFTVYTDSGDVIDLGTEFGIEVDPNGESRVAVFSGKVEVHPRESNKHKPESKITLTEGQAARFSVLAGLRRWEKIALAAKDAGISDGLYAGLVREVRDNLGDSNLHPFYGVVSDGMREGALAFTDKPNPRWLADKGEEFPDWLEGADLIRTYHQFRYRHQYRLQLDLAEPAIVYVLQDSREAPPEWLNREFTNTGARLRVGPWHPGLAVEPGAIIEEDGPYLTADIWKREVPSGVVELGPPREDYADTPVSMYGLAVKPQSSER